jgi:NADH-quinone oxidoreductase subunit L
MDLFVGFGNIFWSNSIYKTVLYNNLLDSEFIPLYVKNIPLVFSLCGILLALCIDKIINHILSSNKIVAINQFKLHFPKSYVIVIWFLNNKWYFDYIYNYYIGYSILKYSYEYFYKLLDKGFIEICHPQGFTFIVYNISNIINKKQSGYIYHLSFMLIIGVFVTSIILFSI